MPTGYTADIKDGITFEQYAMNCARAFGALISMRDESSDTPIPEQFKPSDYHEKALLKAEIELKSLELITSVEADREAKENNERREKSRLKSLSENIALKEKYTSMLESAVSWQPPTDDHKDLHKFMVDQIEKSIEHDCSGDFYAKPEKQLSGEQWLSQQVESAKKNIDYHRKGQAEEIARTDSRNSWLQSLRESLGR